MKLRNKKTGEIVEATDFNIISEYSSLSELNEDWEDYEEPKMYYYITSCGEITHRGYRLWENESVYDKKRQEIGNHFETEEEAEKAVERLCAWKRLKDKGFRFDGWKDTNSDLNDILFELPYMEWDKNVIDDLDSLFGDEK